MGRNVVVRVLGPVRLRAGENWLVPASPQLRLVMGLMALRIGQVVPVAELVDAIWEAKPPRSARASLQALMTRLRRLLKQVPGATLTRCGDGYLLELDHDLVDAERFRSLGRSARAADGAAAIPLFDAALELWNGPALADVPDTERVRAIQHGLAEERLSMLQDRLGGMLACGREREAAAELPAALARHPLNERLAGMLMATWYRSGQRAEALAVFRQIRGRLVTELGVEPGAELQLLHQRILAGDAGLAGLLPGSGQVNSEPAGLAGGRQPAPPNGHQPGPVNGHSARSGQRPARPGTPGCRAGPAGAAVAGAAPASRGPRTVRRPRRRARPARRADRPGRRAGWRDPRPGDRRIAWRGQERAGGRVAHRAAGHFPDGQLYVNLKGFGPAARPVTPEQALRGFLQALGVPSAEIPESLDAQAALYRSVLAGKRVLVLLDNARDAGQVRALLPGSGQCAVVITSRDRLDGLAATVGARISPWT